MRFLGQSFIQVCAEGFEVPFPESSHLLFGQLRAAKAEKLNHEVHGERQTTKAGTAEDEFFLRALSALRGEVFWWGRAPPYMNAVLVP